MSVMGLFFYPSKTNRSSRFYSLFITFIGVAVCSVFLSISFGSSTYAADAAWSNSDRTQISYGEKTFSGPKTNDRDKLETYRFSGWTPSGDGQEGATYYINGTESIIWFPKGTSTGSAGTANYSTLVTTGTNAYTIESKDIKKISIGNDQTSSSLSVVKSIYRTSISDYVNKECQKSFGTNQERSQCRSLVTARFDTCFDGQVKDNSFTFNKDKPGDSIDIRELSGCIANNTDIGSVSQYNGIFSDAKNKANTDGAAAFNDAAPTGDPSDDSQASSCQIDGLGWIICPVLTVTAALVDGAYNFVEALLTVQPILTTGDSQSLYEAWKIMRNLANVAFVIAFLIIIFSQLTSFGVSNYGIKKLLPRIIMAAILVNVSYWICAIAVDASNILGTSLRGLLVNADNGGLAQPKGGVFNGETPWMNATGAILAGTVATGAVLYATLSALLPALLAALVAIVTVFLVLTLRQALIILLIVIAPLAFVALLLPNTESWFKKWRALLQTLLLMYPIIAVIFGASALASKIVMSSANSDNELYETAIQIMGALISILPLAITPVVMKTAGGLLNRFGGIVNNPNKGPIDKLRKGAESVKDSRKQRARGLRLTGQGSNRFSRGFRRTAAVPSRFRNRMAAGSDRNKALNEAADAGYMMNSAAAQEASQIRMAASAANSARQSKALQNLNSEEQQVVLGQANAPDNRSLNAAIRGQIQQGEKQAVGEIEAQLAPASATQLGKTLEQAIQQGDTYTAQAAQNKLSTMGNKGASIMREAIINREKAASDGKTNKNWTEMRVELARNLNGTMMQKDEALKNWATQTEASTVDGRLTLQKTIDDPVTGEPRIVQGSEAGTTDISLAEHTERLTNANHEKHAALSTDKFKNQTPKIQEALLNSSSNPVSEAVITASLNPNNVGSFDPKIVEMMKQKLNSSTTSDNTQPQVQVQTQAPNITVDSQPISAEGVSIPHASPQQSRTEAPNMAGFSSATFNDSGAKIILPDSAIRDIKKASAPTTINNTTNTTETISQQTINQGGWTQVDTPAATPPSGRRSSNAPTDAPSSSSRSSSEPSRSATPRPQDDPASIPNPRDFQ